MTGPRMTGPHVAGQRTDWQRTDWQRTDSQRRRERHVTGPGATRQPRVPPAVMRRVMRLLGSRCLDPALPWQVQRDRLEAFMRLSPLPRGAAVAECSIGGLRAEVVTSGAVASGVVTSGVVTSGVVASGAVASGAAPDRAAAPGGAPRTVVHFHGGGYCVGSPRMARSWAAHLSARAGCRVVLPEYRLAPEHPHPAALEDAEAVVAALASEAGPGSVVVSGDSAGAGLALALLLSMRERGQELPAGCILLSPWLDPGRDRRGIPDLARRDVVLTAEWLGACARAYAGPSAWADHAISPLLAEHNGLPPLLIQAGADELLAPDAELLAAGARAAGVDVTYTRWPGMWHDFALQPGLVSAADSAVAQAAWFLGKLA